MEAAAGCRRRRRRRYRPFDAFEQTLPPDCRAEAAAHRTRRESVARCGSRRDARAASARRDHAGRRRRLPQPDPASRRRIGTRWVVWVGGLTLALGGFFMVRYSIEAGPARPRRAHVARRPVRAGAARCRRMDAAQGKHLRDRSAADRQYPGDPHRRRHRGGVRDRLCRLCAVRFPGARDRLHPARPGGARHAGRGAAARAGAGRPRRRRRLRHAGSGLVRQAGLTGRSTSISPSSPRPRSAWRASGCGAGSRSPRSCSRCCGRSRACNAARRWSARMRSTCIAGFVLAALLVVCGFMFGPPADEGAGRADLVRLAGGLSVRRHADRAEQLPCRHRDDRVRPAGGRQPCSSAWRAMPPPARSAPRRRWCSSCSPNGRCAAIRTCWCCPAARCRASARAPPTDRCRCI